jgi:hypothetical protein
MKAFDVRPRLKGLVLKIEKTGEKVQDSEGVEWEKCVFTVALKGYSRRTPQLELDKKLVDREVKLVRYCAYDWHYKLGVSKTLDPEETEAVLKGETDLTGV